MKDRGRWCRQTSRQAAHVTANAVQYAMQSPQQQGERHCTALSTRPVWHVLRCVDGSIMSSRECCGGCCASLREG